MNYKANGFVDSTSTFIWTSTNTGCRDGLHEIWNGAGIRYTYKEKEYIIVKDPSQDVFAGM